MIPPTATGLDRDWHHALYVSPCTACGAGEETVPVRQSKQQLPTHLLTAIRDFNKAKVFLLSMEGYLCLPFFFIFIFSPLWSSGPLVLWSRGSVVTLVSSTIPYKLLTRLDTDTLGPGASVGRRLDHIHCIYMHANACLHAHADDGDKDVHEDDNDGVEDGGSEIMLSQANPSLFEAPPFTTRAVCVCVCVQIWGAGAPPTPPPPRLCKLA